MERAIEQAVAHLADHPPEDHEDLSPVLARLCRREVGRRRKERTQLVSFDFSVASEASSSTISAAEAAIDAARIRAEAPLKVREAMMMRYGSSDSWSDVAARTGTSPAAIRMSCKRFLERIRQELRIQGGPQ